MASYKVPEKLQLYRRLLKGADRFPTSSRRDVVTSEVRAAFRHPQNESLTNSEVDYKLSLGWERASAISTYANNMYWFHSRDEVTKEMLHHSRERDRVRQQEMDRLRMEADPKVMPPKAARFASAYENVSPGYSKMATQPLQSGQDLWRARGQYSSDVGGPKQKFFVKKHKAVFPQGW